MAAAAVSDDLTRPFTADEIREIEQQDWNDLFDNLGRARAEAHQLPPDPDTTWNVSNEELEELRLQQMRMMEEHGRLNEDRRAEQHTSIPGVNWSIPTVQTEIHVDPLTLSFPHHLRDLDPAAIADPFTYTPPEIRPYVEQHPITMGVVSHLIAEYQTDNWDRRKRKKKQQAAQSAGGNVGQKRKAHGDDLEYSDDERSAKRRRIKSLYAIPVPDELPDERSEGYWESLEQIMQMCRSCSMYFRKLYLVRGEYLVLVTTFSDRIDEAVAEDFRSAARFMFQDEADATEIRVREMEARRLADLENDPLASLGDMHRNDAQIEMEELKTTISHEDAHEYINAYMSALLFYELKPFEGLDQLKGQTMVTFDWKRHKKWRGHFYSIHFLPNN